VQVSPALTLFGTLGLER